MKRSLLVAFAIAVTSTVAVSSLTAAGTARENKRLHEGKITKNEAEHLVLKQYPGARITNCTLAPGKDHSVWVVGVQKAGTTKPIQVQVDGRSGKILP